jgi:hypothetical protein
MMITIKYKNLALIFSIIALMAFGATQANASDLNSNAGTGAMAAIPSSAQKNVDIDKIVSSISKNNDTPQVQNDPPRVQEDPNAGNRVMQRERAVSYFKRDAWPTALPKR